MILPEIGHVGYIVSDVALCVELFKKLCGIEKHVICDFIPDHAWVYGKEFTGCKLRIAQLFPEHGIRIELVQLVSEEKTPLSRVLRKGQSIHHIAYYVYDYAAWYSYYEHLEGASIVFEAQIRDEVMGSRACFYVKMKELLGIFEISTCTKL